MWTLVVWLVLAPADVRSIGPITGFNSKATCEAAGPPIARAVLESGPGEKARVSFVCVRVGGH